MAGRDRKLVVRNTLAPMAEKGLSRPPVILALLRKEVTHPTDIFSGQDESFTCLLFVVRTNIYQMAAKSLVLSHRLQC